VPVTEPLRRSDGKLEAVERKRVDLRVDVERQHIAQRVGGEPASQHARRPGAVPVPQRSRESEVLEWTGQRSLRLERAEQGGGNEASDGPEVEVGRFDGERRERNSDAGLEIDASLPLHVRHRLPRDERVPECPFRPQQEVRRRSVGGGVTAEVPVERERIDERVEQREIEVVGLDVGIAQRRQSRIGRHERGHLPGRSPAPIVQVERIELDLDHPGAVRADRDFAVEHRPIGELGIDEPDVGERCGGGLDVEIVMQRIVRPGDLAPHADA
jgi:hypothetical protein